MRVLVTGADRYIGAVLGSRLVERGPDVVGVDCGYYRDGWPLQPVTAMTDVPSGSGGRSPSKRPASATSPRQRSRPVARFSRFPNILSRPSRNQTGDFRMRSALRRTGYFWMVRRFTSAQIFPQRGCKLNEPNGF
jgi:hypothetical protein